MLKSFILAAVAPISCFWGNGHTAATDPTRRGWKVRPVPGVAGVWLVGQPGAPGCASLMRRRDGRPGLDVAIYLEQPGAAARALAAGSPPDARFACVGDHGGAGMEVVRLIEEERKLLAR